MSVELRIVLVVVSLITLLFISKKIRSSKVKLEDSIFWVCFAAVIFLLSIFPHVFYWLSTLIGTYAPVNFVFLLFIFILLIQSFQLSMRISQADTKIKELTQQLAIEKYERYNNDKNHQSESRDEITSGSEEVRSK